MNKNLKNTVIISAASILTLGLVGSLSEPETKNKPETSEPVIEIAPTTITTTSTTTTSITTSTTMTTTKTTTTKKVTTKKKATTKKVTTVKKTTTKKITTAKTTTPTKNCKDQLPLKALCKDGTYSYQDNPCLPNYRGMCSGHGGIEKKLDRVN